MENGPFIDGLPINSMVIFHAYVSHNQRVVLFLWVSGASDPSDPSWAKVLRLLQCLSDFKMALA